MMDPQQDNGLPGDLSALAWVQDELRKTLDNAHKSLRRHLRTLETASGELLRQDGPPTALLQARNFVHQCVGALALIDLPAPARLLEVSEQALQRLSARGVPFNAKAVEVLEAASFAVLDYLRRMLAGKPAPALSLFPPYRDVAALAGMERVHPADLWADEAGTGLALLHQASAEASRSPVLPTRVRQAIESRLLSFFREGHAEPALWIADRFVQMADQSRGPVSQIWRLSAAFFEAQAVGLLPTDLYAKRMASRLLTQLRAAERGQADASHEDGLLLDLAYFCARAQRDEVKAPRLAAACNSLGIPKAAEVDLERTELGRFDPALIPVARRRLAALKETWSAVAAGELGMLQALPEQGALVADSVTHLYPDGQALAGALQAALAVSVERAQAPEAELAMEVATALLCLDASLDDVDPDHDELERRIAKLSQRLQAAAAGEPSAPLEPWVEALYREVSDRHSMGSVVQELRSSLAEAELQLDRFSRAPDDLEPLKEVPAQLGAMRGVLSVLGLDQAAQAVQRMREDVHAVIEQRAVAATATDDLADNLGALSFLIDLLGVQPQLAKDLFRFDPESGRFSAVMGRTGRAVALDHRAEPEPDAVIGSEPEDVQALAHDGVSDESSQGGVAAVVGDDAQALHTEPMPLVAPPTHPSLPSVGVAPAAQSPAPADDDSDDEMLGIFLEEAHEVIEQAQATLAELARDPQDLGAMTSVRRGFHTLKGSSRMVGLNDFGEVAWACEQLFNARLAEAQVSADAPLLDFASQAMQALSGWADAVEAHEPPQVDGAALTARAHALRSPQWASAAAVVPEPVVPDPFVAEALPEQDVALAPEFAPESEPALEPLDLGPDDWDATSMQVSPDLLEPSVDLELDFDALETSPGEWDDGATAVSWAETQTPEEESGDLALESFNGAEPMSFRDMQALRDSLADALSEVAPEVALEPLPEPVPEPEREPVFAVEPVFEAAPDLEIEPWVEPVLELEPEMAVEPVSDVLLEPFGVDLDLAASEPEALVDATAELERPVTEPMPIFNTDFGVDAVEIPGDSWPEPEAETAAEAPEIAEPQAVEQEVLAATDDVSAAPGDAPGDALGDAALDALDLDLEFAPEAPIQVESGEAPVAPAEVFESVEPAQVVMEPQSAGTYLAAVEGVYAPLDDLSALLPEPALEAAFDLELPQDEPAAFVAELPAPASAFEPESDATSLAPEGTDDSERYKVVGPLRIQIALFNIFLNEADEQSRRLCTALAEWQHEPHQPVSDTATALAHSLAGNSATVGYLELSALARRLEHCLDRSMARGHGDVAEVALYADVADEIRRLLHQFAAGFLKPVSEELLARLSAHEEAEAAHHALLAVQDEAGTEADDDFGATHLAADTQPEPEQVTGYAPLQPFGEMRFSSLEALPAAGRLAEAGRVERVLGSGALAENLDVVDAVDPELFEIFVEEGVELLPQLAEHLRRWEHRVDDQEAAVAAMRALHTFKGGARLAGAMRLGELAHRLETSIEEFTRHGHASAATVVQLHASVDVLSEEFDRLRLGDAAAELAAAPVVGGDAPWASLTSGPVATELAPEPDTTWVTPDAATPALVEAQTTWTAPAEDPAPAESHAQAWAPEAAPAEEPVAAEAAPTSAVSIEPPEVALPVAMAPVRVNWQQLAQRQPGRGVAAPAGALEQTVGAGMVRVRSGLLDRMVNHAGEVGVARARMESDTAQMQVGLRELTDNLERLRRQLRDLELQAETQMASRIEAARSSQQSFDPLEMDRFTRVQELTRMLAESVNDVGTVQRTLQTTLQDTEDQLAIQARINRDLQDDLLRARMVEFDTLSDRLYRVVRQAAKESAKLVRLNFAGGGVELDRAVLDRMAPAFEHLLRNAVVHGIETPSLREALGKPATGTVEVQLRQMGNEVEIEVRDDGAGLDLARIAERARTMGLLGPDSRPTESELAGMIFLPGMTTAEQVTELAGRGIGMDVVRSEVTSMGGRIETASTSGRGTAFRMVLPLTTAVTQVVVVQSGDLTVALPSTLVELVRRVPAKEVEEAYLRGVLRHGDKEVPFFWLGSLLQSSLRGATEGRTLPVLVVRSAAQQVAVHVSDVLGNQEVVVKNLGPQLSRLPGLAGMSLLPTGSPVLIYNAVALAAVYGAEVRTRMLATPLEYAQPEQPQEVVEPVRQAALVMVVDDSLTVRRVTQRLLQREGYRVVLARDGLDALERLADEKPAVMLCDIEMPRMDGFDLVRNLRSDPRLATLPVVMITSRIAEKHQEHARELGVNHYLGKPYNEDLLMSLVRQYAGEPALA